jgi:hypothetical protein
VLLLATMDIRTHPIAFASRPDVPPDRGCDGETERLALSRKAQRTPSMYTIKLGHGAFWHDARAANYLRIFRPLNAGMERRVRFVERRTPTS